MDLTSSTNFKNKEILLHTTNYIISTKRFEKPLIEQC